MANLMMKWGLLAAGQFPGYFLRRGSVTILKILSYRGWDFEMGKGGYLPGERGLYQFRLWATSLKMGLGKRPSGHGLQPGDALFHRWMGSKQRT